MKLNSIFVAVALACGVLARPFSDIKYYTRDLDFGEVGARELYDINYPREVYEELYARGKSVSLRLIVCSMCVAHSSLSRRKKRRPRKRPRKQPKQPGKRRKDRTRPRPNSFA